MTGAVQRLRAGVAGILEDSASSSAPPGSLTRRELAAIVKNDRRSAVIQDLADRSEPVEVPQLTDRQAAREADGRDVSSSERKAVYISLYQTNLPKLDEYDVGEYEQARGRVWRGDNYAQARRALELLDGLTTGGQRDD